MLKKLVFGVQEQKKKKKKKLIQRYQYLKVLTG